MPLTNNIAIVLADKQIKSILLDKKVSNIFNNANFYNYKMIDLFKDNYFDTTSSKDFLNDITRLHLPLIYFKPNNNRYVNNDMIEIITSINFIKSNISKEHNIECQVFKIKENKNNIKKAIDSIFSTLSSADKVKLEKAYISKDHLFKILQEYLTFFIKLVEDPYDGIRIFRYLTLINMEYFFTNNDEFIYEVPTLDRLESMYLTFMLMEESYQYFGYKNLKYLGWPLYIRNLSDRELDFPIFYKLEEEFISKYPDKYNQIINEHRTAEMLETLLALSILKNI